MVDEANLEVVHFGLNKAKAVVERNLILRHVAIQKNEIEAYRRKVNERVESVFKTRKTIPTPLPPIFQRHEVDELLVTIKWVYEQLGNYLDVVPSVVKQQIFLVETADRQLKRMLHDGQYEQYRVVAPRAGETLGYFFP